MAIVYASRDGGIRKYNDTEVQTVKLQEALDRAGPGDIVELLPGRYQQPARLTTSGTDVSPITIRGQADGTAVLDGCRDRAAGTGVFQPSEDDFAFLKLLGVHWYRLEHLVFENCWPTAVFIQGCKDIRLSNCHFTGSRFTVYARNLDATNKTRRILLDGVSWVQDPDHDMWEGRITWKQVKEQDPALDASFLNGALFGSLDIKGPVAIRNCDVTHAFNVIRMDASSTSPDRGRNHDILIENNRFSFIRDNGVEPEKTARNLWVVGNRFFNVHAVFSLDGVSGGNWYYINNRVLNVEAPGHPSEDERGGKIFKFDKTTPSPYPDAAFVVVHNSIQTRTAYAKKGQTRNWLHHNNAIGICREGTDCIPDRTLFSSKLIWHDSYHFENDICDLPDYPERMRGDTHMVAGTRSAPASFKKPRFSAGKRHNHGDWDGELHLTETSPGRQSAGKYTFPLMGTASLTVPGGGNIGADDSLPLNIPGFDWASPA